MAEILLPGGDGDSQNFHGRSSATPLGQVHDTASAGVDMRSNEHNNEINESI